MSVAGARTDLKDAVKRLYENGSVDEVFDTSEKIRCVRSIQTVVQLKRDEDDKAANKQSFVGAVLRPWQEELLEKLKGEVNPREVIWVYDEEGNKGKTYLAKYCVAEHDAIMFTNGKTNDIKYGYRGQRIVIFNFTRSEQEHINYGVIEAIKDGIYFSPKYESSMKVYQSPHLVCMANMLPDESKMSADRWNIITL